MTFGIGIFIGIVVGWVALDVYDLIDEAFGR
jgi:hypothetical protein